MLAEGKPQHQSPKDTAQQPELPPLGLHQAIEQAGAYKFLVSRKQTILEAYLTTDATMGDLKRLAGVKTTDGVRVLIHRSMRQVFPHLPLEIQQKYGSPKEAIRTKSAHQTEISKRRIRQGLDRLKRTDIGKSEFSDDHKTHLSEGASRRWQRVREANKATQTED